MLSEIKKLHYITVKGSNLQEYITIVNVIKSLTKSYMSQKLIKLQGKIDEFTIVVGSISNPPSEMDRSSRPKNNTSVVRDLGWKVVFDIYCVNIDACFLNSSHFFTPHSSCL